MYASYVKLVVIKGNAMKLGEKGFKAVLRITILGMLAIGVPKVFFAMQSQARHGNASQEFSIQEHFARELFVQNNITQEYSHSARELSAQRNVVQESVAQEYSTSRFFVRDFSAQKHLTREHSVREDLARSRMALKQGCYDGCGLPAMAERTAALITNQMYESGVASSVLERLIVRGMTVQTILVPFPYQKDGVQKWAEGASYIPSAVPLVMGEGEALFSAEHLAGCDALFFDVQDTGVRTDGYVALLYAALRAARDHKKDFIIIDHPNPLGGAMEGWCSRRNGGDPLARIPLRHGMTLAELAQYMNKSLLASAVAITTMPLERYDRFAVVDVRMIRRPFSRNIPSLESCRCYSFLGALGELSPFDVAVGTRYPFQALLLPEKSTVSRDAWKSYSALLKEHGIESRLWRYYSKRKQQWFLGVRIFIPDSIHFSSSKVFVDTVTFFKNRGIKFVPSVHFDQLIGTTVVRRVVDGEISWKSGLNEVQKASRLFFKEAFSSCLYKPLPREVQIAE